MEFSSHILKAGISYISLGYKVKLLVLMRWQLKRAENTLCFDDSRMTNTLISSPHVCQREKRRKAAKQTFTKQVTKKPSASSESPQTLLRDADENATPSWESVFPHL